MPVTTEHPKRPPKPQRRGSSRNASSNNVANPKLLTQKEIANYVNHLPPHLKELDKLRGKRSGSTQVNSIHDILLILATSLTVPRSIPDQALQLRSNPPSTTHSRPLSRTGSTQRIHGSRAPSNHAARTSEMVVGTDPGGDEDGWVSSESAMASPAPEPTEEAGDNDPEPLVVNQLHPTPPSTLLPPTQPQMQPSSAKVLPGLALNEAHPVHFVGGEPTLAQDAHTNGAPYHPSPPPLEAPNSVIRVNQSLSIEGAPSRPSQTVIDRDEPSSSDESEGDTEEEEDDDNEGSTGPELRGRTSGGALARAHQARPPQSQASRGNQPLRMEQPTAVLESSNGRPPSPHRDTTPTPVTRNQDPQPEPSRTTSSVIGRRNGTVHDPSKRHSFQPGQLPSSAVYASSTDQTVSPPTRPKRHSITSRPVSSHGHNSPLNLLVRIPGQASTPSPLTAPPAVSRTTSDNAAQEPEYAFQASQDFERSLGRGLKKKGSVSSINSAATVPVGKSPPTAFREDVIATIIPLSKTSSSSSSAAMLSNLAQKRHSTTSTSGAFAGLTLPGFGYGYHYQQLHPRESSLPSETPLVSQFYPPNAWGPHVFSLLGTEDLRRHLTATMYRQPMTEAYERVCAMRPSATHTKRT
jgi:hypothetical protein